MPSPASATCFPSWSLIPFVLMLVSIAVLPAVAHGWWESHRNKTILSIVVSLPVLGVVLPCEPRLLWHSLLDYGSFLVLLTSVFVIAGGIYVKGEYAGTPPVNTLFLAIGAILANVIGTPGASMLLIRPFLRANHLRRHRAHLIVFFIFIVCNIAGLLTPVGPPLFLGFLRGIPFHWTLRLFPQWALVVGGLLIVFNIYDGVVFAREEVETHRALAEIVQARHPLGIEGGINCLYLLCLVGAIVCSGYFGWPRGVLEAVMIAAAILSWFTTPRAIHRANHFHFSPVVEIASLFLGIFVTMVPALEILNARASTISLQTPWQFFWVSGLLSAVLDNAPTYLTFTAMASGLAGGGTQDMSSLLKSESGQNLLAAISCGSVFMGAMTYIGNAPNFMVKSIAERHDVETPSFSKYVVCSALILTPLFVLLTFVFFRG
jgi:Na+/H+ antiporter NhaD/arsenite permease-like protein